MRNGPAMDQINIRVSPGGEGLAIIECSYGGHRALGQHISLLEEIKEPIPAVATTFPLKAAQPC